MDKKIEFEEKNWFRESRFSNPFYLKQASRLSTRIIKTVSILYVLRHVQCRKRKLHLSRWSRLTIVCVNALEDCRNDSRRISNQQFTVYTRDIPLWLKEKKCWYPDVNKYFDHRNYSVRFSQFVLILNVVYLYIRLIISWKLLHVGFNRLKPYIGYIVANSISNWITTISVRSATNRSLLN